MRSRNVLVGRGMSGRLHHMWDVRVMYCQVDTQGDGA